MKKIFFALIALSLFSAFAQDAKQTKQSSLIDELPKEEVQDNDTTLSLIIGTWYCKDAGIIAYLDFYEDGTGKSYFQEPNNFSSFKWSINGSEIIIDGQLKNTNRRYSSKQFEVTADTLWFKKLIGYENLTYIRQ